MECRNLEINIVSANNLPNIRNIGMMKVYARVSLKGEPTTTQETLVDTKGATNPRWNFPLHFTISESSLRKPGVRVVVKLLCKRSMGDRVVGKVNIEVKTLFDLGLKAHKIMSYAVVGTTKGRLNLLYSFSDKVVLVAKPSGWRSAVEVGLFVVVGGALILLGRKSDAHRRPRKVSRVHDVDECENDEIFYDAV